MCSAMWGDSWSGGKQLNSRSNKDNDLKDLKEIVEFNRRCKSPSNMFMNYIDFNKFSGRPSIKLKFQNKWIDVLLDTGANINVIKDGLINNIYCIEKQNKNITCANGESLNVIGKTQ